MSDRCRDGATFCPELSSHPIMVRFSEDVGYFSTFRSVDHARELIRQLQDACDAAEAVDAQRMQVAA